MDKDRLAGQLLVDEGFRSAAYTDRLGYLTIGVGRLIDERKGGGVSREEALFLLRNDIDRHWSELSRALPWVAAAPEEVQEVLANMCFNLGLPGLRKFARTLALLEQGRYRAAADEMLNSAWAGQVGARAQRLAGRIRALEPG